MPLTCYHIHYVYGPLDGLEDFGVGFLDAVQVLKTTPDPEGLTERSTIRPPRLGRWAKYREISETRHPTRPGVMPLPAP